MKFHVKATGPDGARVVKEVEAATGFDAVTAVMKDGLSGVVAHPIRDPYGVSDAKTRAADRHAADLEVRFPSSWGQA